MLTPLVVLWLGAPAELATHHADIASWASARGGRAVAPLEVATPRYDPGLAAEVEALLEQARTDATGSAALERAEAIVDAHPELPQAAWLLAERLVLEAQAAGDDGERVNELSRRAAALEGERARAAGAAPAVPSGVAGAAATSLQTNAARLTLTGLRPLDRLYVGGVRVDPETPVPKGRQHVQIVRGAATVWSAWVDAGPEQSDRMDPAVACSALDLAGVGGGGADALQPPPGILCPRWAVARRGLAGNTELATCERSRCGPWERPPHVTTASGAPSNDRSAEGRWPAWATWSLLGVGAAAATGLVLWQAGAFEQPAPSTEFVFTGPNAAAYRF